MDMNGVEASGEAKKKTKKKKKGMGRGHSFRGVQGHMRARSGLTEGAAQRPAGAGGGTGGDGGVAPPTAGADSTGKEGPSSAGRFFSGVICTLFPPAAHPRRILRDVLIANAMVMLFAVRAGGDGGARGLFQLAASREYDFVLTATTVVVLLWWLCRSMFNGGGGGGGASDTLPGTRASLESTGTTSANPMFEARRKNDIIQAKTHILKARQLLSLLVERTHQLELKARSNEDVGSFKDGVDSSLSNFQAQMLAQLNSIVQASASDDDGSKNNAASAVALEAAKSESNNLRVQLGIAETKVAQLTHSLDEMRKLLSSAEDRHQSELSRAKDEQAKTLERLGNETQSRLDGMQKESLERERMLNGELRAAREELSTAREQHLEASKEQRDMAAHIEQKAAALRELEKERQADIDALNQKLQDEIERAANRRIEEEAEAAANIERLEQLAAEAHASRDKEREKAERAEAAHKVAESEAEFHRSEREKAERDAADAQSLVAAAQAAEAEARSSAEAAWTEMKAAERSAKEQVEAAVKVAKEEAEALANEKAEALAQAQIAEAARQRAAEEESARSQREAEKKLAQPLDLSKRVSDTALASGVTPELEKKLKKARRRSEGGIKVDTELVRKEWEKNAAADLERAVVDCRATSLFKLAHGQNGPGDDVSSVSDATVEMSGTLGMMIHVEQCEAAIDELERILDVVRSKAPFQHVEGGNALLSDAQNLNEILNSLVEEQRDMAMSAEAKAEARAAAEARGMPECLQWTLQRRQLVRELVAEEIPGNLKYTPSERQTITSEGRSLRWVFVPDDDRCYLPAKVLDEVESSSGSGWRMKSKKLLECMASNGALVKVEMSDAIHELEDPSILARVPDDLADSVGLNEATLLHHLRARFTRNHFYTALGNILISINPFKWDDRLYAKNVIQFYVDNRQLSMRKRHLPPHTFAIAERAYLALAQRNAKDQAIIISGESGAGKTEVAKQCLAYLAAVSMKSIKKKTTGNSALSTAARQANFSKSRKSRKKQSTRSLLMMGYAPGVSSKLIDKIVLANPILEAFGNAKTLRNSNSSRFGKWLIVHYDDRHSILGCANKVYLLEKSRVVFQSMGERNFHIFYMLLLGADADVQQTISLDKDTLESATGFAVDGENACKAFHYVNQSGVFSLDDNHNEESHFHELMNALEALEFSDKSIHEIFKCVAAVLYLGNVTFVSTDAGAHGGASKDSCKVTDASRLWLKKAAALLSVPSDGAGGLGSWLCRHRMPTKGRAGPASVTMIGHKPEKAIEVRNATAKAIYDRLFKWIVNRINSSAGPEDINLSRRFIGLLDIFGFEVFEKNGFDQLCINYANEKLQLLFNESTFKGEMALYKDEGLELIEGLKLPDNSNVINIIGGKKNSSVFRLLDDENKRREAGSNEDFFRKILRDLSKGANYRPKKGEPVPVISGDERKNVFTVRHFAGDVSYSPDGFVETNADTLIAEIRETLAASDGNDVIAELFAEASSDNTGEQKQRTLVKTHEIHAKKKKEKTVSGLFRHDIDSLVRKIGPDKKTGLWSTDPHFIRCIKSNKAQQPGLFEDPFILTQLRCAGIPEAGSILRAGYPFRLKHSEFRVENEKLAPLEFEHPAGDKEWCRRFVEYFESEVPQFEGTKIGKTMVLLGGKQNFHLTAYRTKLDVGITLLQARARGYLQRTGKKASMGGPPLSPPPPSGVAALAGLRDNGSQKISKSKPLSGLARTMSKHAMKGTPNDSPKRGTILPTDVHEERHF